MDFLVFQLYGVLASWGDIAVGEVRPIQKHPSKSSIIGMLAGAFGIKREEEKKHIEIAQQYGIAFCLRWEGREVRDFHTIQVSDKNHNLLSTRKRELDGDKNTILSYRDYRVEAFYQVAIWKKTGKTLFSLEEIKQALEYPKFPLYLGRKSCPLSLPLYPIILSNVSLKQAFDGYPLNKATEWTGRLGASHLISYFWEKDYLQEKELGMSPTMIYPRCDQVVSRKRWQFSNREECYYAENLSGNEG